jgi:hypothetical protein
VTRPERAPVGCGRPPRLLLKPLDRRNASFVSLRLHCSLCRDSPRPRCRRHSTSTALVLEALPDCLAGWWAVGVDRMDSPHALGLDEHHNHNHHHHFSAPPNVTTVAFTHTHAPSHPAAPSCPPSPTAIAAATTLATLAEGRPEYDEDEDEDDDDSGGISITSADLHEHSAAGALTTGAYMTEQDMVEQLQSIMATSPLFPFSAPSQMPTAPVDPILPIPHLSFAYISSSDPVLEPLPPTLQEAHLSIEDNGSFAPITSFFHRITPARPTVPGLDLVTIPSSITREMLRGDRLDPQGIDWTVRNTTRFCVRAKRFECEVAQLPPSSHQVRKVSSTALSPLSS